ncbi:site-specific integrase [Nocardia suismassiliense]|uniref:site-specific integrase n=1 Tax=Nocardia suismassiliense TaxID=2077092 RepID=UPI0018FF0B43
MRVQQVLSPAGGRESWTVVDSEFAVVEPVDEFLAYLTAIERSPGTVRSYAFDLRDYFTFLAGHEIDWRTARLEHFRPVRRIASPAARDEIGKGHRVAECGCAVLGVDDQSEALGGRFVLPISLPSRGGLR